MPKKEKRKCHNSLAIPQWMRRWFADSSAPLHIQQKPTKTHHLLLSWSIVGICPQVASRAKKLTLVGAQDPYPIFEGKVTSPFASMQQRKTSQKITHSC